jgi:hypothetical protein
MRKFILIGAVATAAMLAWPAGEAKAQVVSFGVGNPGYVSPGYGGYTGLGYYQGYQPGYGNVYQSRSYYGGYQQPFVGGYRTSSYGYAPGFGYGQGYSRSFGYSQVGGFNRGFSSGWRR